MPRAFLARCQQVIAVAMMALAVPLARVSAQGATAIVEGRITDAANSRPLENVQVNIDGTTLGGMTNAQGNYRIPGITVTGGSSQVVVRVRAIGYSRETRSVTVTPGSRAVRRLEISLIGAFAGGVMTATVLPSRFTSVF